MDPKHLSIADFSYELPVDRIAHYPLAERDASKLLIYREGQIREDFYRNIAGHLPGNALLVFNNTRVVEARILFQKATGARIELFCLEPPAAYGGMANAMAQQGSVQWKCLIGGASKWKPGQVLIKEIDHSVKLEARYIAKQEDAFLIELSWTPKELSFAELLHHAGLIPLPPYIRRQAEESDSQRYQTIYAQHDGSVAAPTAGLHFTEKIFGTLAEKSISQTFVTLHVGAGTFLPVKAAQMEGHVMHTEYISVARPAIEALIAQMQAGRLVVPVGTTSLRTIESLYWLGLRVIQEPQVSPEELYVRQWDPYQESSAILPRPEAALEALLDWMERYDQPQLLSRTQLLITPGYSWKITGALVTNFHQPESTLLLLVAALIGPDWRKVYQYAMDNEFRFLSYGDGSLLFR